MPNKQKGKVFGKGSGGVTGKGFRPGQSGNAGRQQGRGLITAVMTVAMTRQMGDPIPDEPERSYAARIGANAVIVLDQQLEQCRKQKRFDRDIIPLMEFVAERLEGKIPQTLAITKSVETRSDEDLVYYTTHRHFPEEPCRCPAENPSTSSTQILM